MRPALTPEQFRAAGIYLNGGHRRGWRKRVAMLLDTPETTVAAWASRTPGNARSIPGSAAVAMKLLVAMLQQREIAERNLPLAAQIVCNQVLTLVRLSDFLPEQESELGYETLIAPSPGESSPGEPGPGGPGEEPPTLVS